ncbi:translation initiation factor IF-2 [Candidatus Uhrbacteria bacterium RIFCSPHIGHO2_02_FULL_47_44]|uniref:Translation initiation factor IF-2 n=1 Tax=Candidatus Uhrbacteria bacterium RIFCSPLOWO2_02_FULL_48_18 TaxID=1802408 RepID=A0A1F7VDS7_9BACT|nr:MAG: translation initiation factor IF-2 [Candidatus Uhrbacteria bacterium RIFCSPHIGHO2_01_FULL_47_10]OGL70025.1 MAG: translation initiation factor IF-2 [Candidatus Uhrbacteria bacterium RIFCSPHIGHO2_02_FULL_47_44]OGL77317.1 MAG: translation initiation factor IF-2 [Candidatus Uhrbacteria bacterium RIFCSPHIGHO2_12_FULL_47_12]OGL80680.1 MAG: translation initiation factor IF-2 [Candidatus Uhrbacteria bacterium RIFCSPLOWO2_01_FULL_47_17]OGL88137.1 MAG: translation initiation factor IF-2 [Candidat
MNITELARRLRVRPDELLQKLPELGFAVGARAIKVDDRQAQKIMEAWAEMSRKERLARKVEMQKAHSGTRLEMPEEDRKPVKIPAITTVRDFASLLDLSVPRIMQELMKNGILASINERIDFDTASIIAEDLGFRAELDTDTKNNNEDTSGIDKIRERSDSEKKEDLVTRPPVVVVMGHVDHGKTKLLDAIRTTNVMATEAGGITQHIGAYQVERNGRHLTFIDTPGHEAFTVMRSRGAKVADIAILVVAADDGVQPQTKEAINIIKSANLPFIVALNKIDKEGANIDRVKGELAELNITAEDWGGSSIIVPVSAREGKNIDQLLDMLLLVTDMEKDRIVANPNARAIGTVVESHVDTGTGPVATVLVQSGTLSVGDTLSIRDTLYGRVRAMKDWNGKTLLKATPSTPVEIVGFKVAPAVGDVMDVPNPSKELKKMKATDSSMKATEEMASIHRTQAQSEESKTEEGKKHVLPLIIRSDVLGSLEAILGMIDKIKHEDVSVKVIKKGLGNITDTDVQDAEAGGAIIMAFNTRPSGTAEILARDKHVSIRKYDIIYRLFDDVIEELKKLLPAELIITELGGFEVVKVFRKTDHGFIVGGKVKKSKILPKTKLRISRNGEYVGEGEILVLQLGPGEIKEGQPGQEIGLSFKGKVKPEEGDIFETYTEEKITKLFKIEGIDAR